MTKKDAGENSNTPSRFNPASFFQEAKGELDKVVWPSRQQLIGESVSVILMVILSATLISLIDKLFSWMAGRVF
ncbi:MAG TPA: preprotein translocase subunit SecE [Candidatus Caenarcaniphilales bacterium]